eukprot:TRINITY_DN1921_c0_g2_i1.p1 TRINITY_DN1921_c0_g2~~TRINITY_DN1921_c0_g2_i1.p1  ORF type:complete len:336 (-),score=161.24 TRINITY_DN1921_c0_g2_i1:150-1097(-)
MAEEKTLLQELTLRMLVADKRGLVAVQEDETLEDALAVLARENVLSLPVWNSDRSGFVGIISMWDVMTYVAFGTFSMENPTPDQFEVFQKTQVKVGDVVAARLHDESKKVWEFSQDEPIETVLEPMSKGVHRVLVKKEDGYSLLTQTDLIRFLISYSSYGQRVGDAPITDVRKPIGELGLLGENKPKLLTLREDLPAVDGFRIIDQHGFTAAPVVNAAGEIVGTLSASDLRGLRSHHLSSVLLPITEFLALKWVDSGARRGVVVARNGTLHEAVVQMVLRRVHRVWVMDDDGKTPIGVVSMSDVISKFSPYDFLV